MCWKCDATGPICEYLTDSLWFMQTSKSSGYIPSVLDEAVCEITEKNDYGDSAQKRSGRASAVDPKAPNKRKWQSVSGIVRPMRDFRPILIP